MTMNKTLRTGLGAGRIWRELEIRGGKVYGRSDPSGEPLSTTPATLRKMIDLGWFKKLPRGERYEFTRQGMQAWIAEQTPTVRER